MGNLWAEVIDDDGLRRRVHIILSDVISIKETQGGSIIFRKCGENFSIDVPYDDVVKFLCGKKMSGGLKGERK